MTNGRASSEPSPLPQAALPRNPRPCESILVEDPVIRPDRDARRNPGNGNGWVKLPQQSQAMASLIRPPKMAEDGETNIERRNMPGISFQHRLGQRIRFLPLVDREAAHQPPHLFPHDPFGLCIL